MNYIRNIFFDEKISFKGRISKVLTFFHPLCTISWKYFLQWKNRTFKLEHFIYFLCHCKEYI